MYDGEAFIVLPGVGQYKILNAVGTRVWELIDGVRDEAEIAKIITDEYDVALETAREDVTSFVSDLRAHGMLQQD